MSGTDMGYPSKPPPQHSEPLPNAADVAEALRKAADEIERLRAALLAVIAWEEVPISDERYRPFNAVMKQVREAVAAPAKVATGSTKGDQKPVAGQ